jgi:nucleoid-associated protein YgaU
MKNRYVWLVLLGALALVVAAPSSRALAGEAQQKAAEPAQEEKKAEPAMEEKKAEPAKEEKKAEAEKPAGMVGKIVAVAAQVETLVVDIPLGKDVLTVGGWVTPKTKITREGKAVKLDSLKAGERVRVTFHRIPTGDNFTSVEVLK